VYPTWWMNVPAALKGFVDRTFLPHVAFRLPVPPPAKAPAPVGGSVSAGVAETGLVPLLTNIERVGVVSTYGASRLIVTAAGDNGRGMWSAALRPLFASGCTLRWHGLYEMDSTSGAQRSAFLEEVEAAYRGF